MMPRMRDMRSLDDFCNRMVARRSRQFVIAVEGGLRGRQLTRRR